MCVFFQAGPDTRAFGVFCFPGAGGGGAIHRFGVRFESIAGLGPDAIPSLLVCVRCAVAIRDGGDWWVALTWLSGAIGKE